LGRYRFGRCRFDSSSRLLCCAGKELVLRGKVAELLALLLEHPNSFVSSEELRERLWPEGFVESGNLPQHVYLLRRALAVDPTVSVENVARHGYRLRARIAGVPRLRAPSSGAVWRGLGAAFAAAFLLVLPGPATVHDPTLLRMSVPGDRAYELGRTFWERRGPENLKRAMGFFDQTVAAAPFSAKGYSGQADVFGVLADDLPYGTPAQRAMARRAVRAAQIALQKDPNFAAAHAALGLALMEAGASERESVAELRRAIDLDPRNAEAHEWYGIRLLYGGDVRTARQHFEIAAEVQPANVAVAWWRAVARYDLHDEDEAIDDFRTALALNPSYGIAQIGLVTALIERGRYGEAREAARESHDARGSEIFALRGLTAILDLRLGERRIAETEMRRLGAEESSRKVGDGDELVVAALALGGHRQDALRLRARLHLEKNEAAQRMIDLDPLVGPVFRRLAITRASLMPH